MKMMCAFGGGFRVWGLGLFGLRECVLVAFWLEAKGLVSRPLSLLLGRVGRRPGLIGFLLLEARGWV